MQSLLSAFLGPVSLETFCLNVFLVIFSVFLGSWVDFHREALESEEGERQKSKTGESVLEDEFRKAALDHIKSLLPSLNIPVHQIGTRRERNPWPRWVELLGGIYGAFALSVCLLSSSLFMSLISRQANYFEILGIKPSSLFDPRIGVLIKKSIDRGVDFASFGMNQEAYNNLTRTMRDERARVLYEHYGIGFDINVSTFTQAFFEMRGVFLFYSIWLFLLAFISSTSFRHRTSFGMGGLWIGIAFFLDGSITFNRYSLSSPYMAFIPHLQWMCTYEKQFYLRHFGVPLVIMSTFLYTSHTFVDYDEHSFSYIMEMLLYTYREDVAIQNIIKSCSQRREGSTNISTERSRLESRDETVQEKIQEQNQEMPTETNKTEVNSKKKKVRKGK